MTRYPKDKAEKPLIITGEWHFGWVLNGLAMQDVWIVPRRDMQGNLLTGGPWLPTIELTAAHSAAENFLEYGTTIRFFVPEDNCYRAVWAGPLQNKTYMFTAQSRRSDDGSTELEMLTTDPISNEERIEVNKTRQSCGKGEMRKEGRLMKWCLTGITKETFQWKEWLKEDESDEHWSLREEFLCKRQ